MPGAGDAASGYQKKLTVSVLVALKARWMDAGFCFEENQDVTCFNLTRFWPISFYVSNHLDIALYISVAYDMLCSFSIIDIRSGSSVELGAARTSLVRLPGLPLLRGNWLQPL
ncbi:unnamed protein product, partial [Durusdinium trenchii]